ncbi:MAG: type II toxin-antitoxin system PemK/MazF family toxin [Patescibacteria group bacterium]
MVTRYVPERGDVVWLSFGKTKGHEQSGRRPALVLSASFYQKASGLAVVCPITSVVKSYPFRVDFQGKKINGVIITDQVQSVAWKERRAQFIEVAGRATLLSVVKNIVVLIGVKPF